MEKGTLYQLRNLVNNTTVPTSNVEKHMKATEDFFLMVLKAHVLSAAYTILHNSTNLHTTVSLAEAIVEKFVDIEIADVLPTVSNDRIHEYACEVLTLLLIWHNFYDATKEGDGDRLMLVWKLLLLIFKATNRRNYSKEAAILLLQKESLLPKRQAAQLVWSRFVNVRGIPGHNIPTDLHMEHLNRRLKTILRQTCSNVINPNTIVKASQSIGFVHQVCCTFESECGTKHTWSTQHAFMYKGIETHGRLPTTSWCFYCE